MRCGWERVLQCDVKSLPTLFYSPIPLSTCFPLPSPITAHQAAKLLPTQTHLHLQLLEAGGATRVGSIMSYHRWFTRPLLQTYTTLLVK